MYVYRAGTDRFLISCTPTELNVITLALAKLDTHDIVDNDRREVQDHQSHMLDALDGADTAPQV